MTALRRIFVLGLASTASFVPHVGAAQEPTEGGAMTSGGSGSDYFLIPRAAFGVQYYDFKQHDSALVTLGNVQTTSAESSREFRASMPMLKGGLTLARRLSGTGPITGVYGDIYYQKAFDGSDDSSYSSSLTNSFAGFSQNLSVAGNADADFDREEYGITLGLNFEGDLTAYAGWKWAKSAFTEKRGGRFQFDDSFLFFPLGVRATGPWAEKFEYDFENNGPFLGIGYAFDIAGAGQLQVNGGVAFLDGEFKNQKITNQTFRIDRIDVAVDGIPLGGFPVSSGDVRIPPTGIRSFKGNSTGFNLGLAWTGNTKWDNLKYKLALEGYQYTFNADDKGVGDVTEVAVNFYAGINWAFGL